MCQTTANCNTLLHVPIVHVRTYCHQVTSFIHVRTCYSYSIQPRLLYESGNYFFQHIRRCGIYSRVATNREWRVIERIRYISVCWQLPSNQSFIANLSAMGRGGSSQSRPMINGGQLPTKQLSDSNWGAFDHASQLLSDNYYVVCGGHRGRQQMSTTSINGVHKKGGQMVAVVFGKTQPWRLYYTYVQPSLDYIKGWVPPSCRYTLYKYMPVQVR